MRPYRAMGSGYEEGPGRGAYEDSVEHEMNKLEKEMRRNSFVGDGAYGQSSPPLYTNNHSNENYNSNPSPLAQALESQVSTRHYIPRPSSGKEKKLDIFGAESSEYYVTKNARADSPSRNLRVQRRQQQEEYARQVADAAERVPSGGLKRNVYLTGDSLLDKIGGDVTSRTPAKPLSVDPMQQRAREDKRVAQMKYAELIRQDSEALPLSASIGRKPLRTPSRSDDMTREDFSIGSNENIFDTKKESQRTYREQLDRDIAQRDSSGYIGSSKSRDTGREMIGSSLFDKFSGGDCQRKQDQQSEYARMIAEARDAPPISDTRQRLRRQSDVDESEENKYTAFKRHSDSGLVTRRARSPVVDRSHPANVGTQNYMAQSELDSGYGGASNRREAPSYDGEPYYTDSYRGAASHEFPEINRRSGSRDANIFGTNELSLQSGYGDTNSSTYNRFESKGEDSSIGAYSTASRKVQDYKNRQRAYADAEEDFDAKRFDSAPAHQKQMMSSDREDEIRKKREQQLAYARDINAYAKAAPIAAPRVSLLRAEQYEGNGLPGGYRVRGTSTGGGVSNFRLG